MGWREFFKPSKFKLLVSSILLVYAYLYFYFLIGFPNKIITTIASILTLILYAPVIVLLSIFLYYNTLPSTPGFAFPELTLGGKIIEYVIVIIYAYLLSGIIELVYGKLRK